MSSCQCIGVKKLFNDKTARRDLKKYLKKGPNKTTQILLNSIKERLNGAETLLDIGGGVGVIQHELYEAGLKKSTDVDASPAYLGTAEKEAERRNHSSSSEFIEGDFTDESIQPPAVDIVTLDRVICCYDEMEKLVEKSSSLAGKLYGVVYPRDTVFVKFTSVVGRIVMTILRNPFRMFVHDPRNVDEIIKSRGLKPVFHDQTFYWRIDLYAKG